MLQRTSRNKVIITNMSVTGPRTIGYWQWKGIFVELRIEQDQQQLANGSGTDWKRHAKLLSIAKVKLPRTIL